MPGLDGTGPRGRGPITGEGRGLCVMKFPADPGASPAGVAGRTGWQFGQPIETDKELAHLRRCVQQIEAALTSLRRQIEQLQAIPSQRSHGE